MSKALGILNQPRVALEEFLKADARVIYEYLFSTRHVGRIIDLIVHEMRKFFDEGLASEDAASLEHRMRSVMELAVFNAWTNYRKGEKVRAVNLEVGWDFERAIVMVSSLVDDDIAGLTPGGSSPSNATAERIARMIAQVKQKSDGMVIRHSKETGGFQLIAFIDAPKADVKSISTDLPDYLDLKQILVAAETKPLAPEGVSPEPLALGDLKGFTADEKQDEKDRLLLRNKREGKAMDDGEVEFRIKADSLMKEPETERKSSEIKSSDPSEETWLKKMLKKEQEENGDSDAEITLKSGKEKEQAKDSSFAREKLKEQGKDKSFAADKEKEEKDTSFAKDKEKEKAKSRSFGQDEKEERVVTDKRVSTTEDEESKDISIKTEHLGADQTALKVGKTDIIEEGEMRVKSGSSAEELNDDAVKLSGKETDDVEEAIQVLLNAIKAELVDLLPNLSETEFEEMFRDLSTTIRENFMQSAHHIGRLRTIQMVSKVKLYKDQIQLLSSKVSSLQATVDDLQGKQGPRERAMGGREEVAVTNAVNSVDARFNNLIQRFKESIEKGDLPSSAQQWAHGMMESILKDKAEVNQKIRDVDSHLKKKEFEFKSKETAFKEELRIKEEQTRQKAFALDKTREVLQGTLKQLDRLKKISASSESEAELKHKIVVGEKLLNAANENSSKLSKRVDELQRKWQDEFSTRSELQKELSNSKRLSDELSRKMNDASNNKADSRELSQMLLQRDRAMKVVEELKKQNKELQDKVNGLAATAAKPGAPTDPKKAATTVTDAEMKHRLDHANKLVKAMKDEIERNKKRYDEIKLSETNLKVELVRVQEKLRAQDKQDKKPAPAKPASAITKPIPPKK